MMSQKMLISTNLVTSALLLAFAASWSTASHGADEEADALSLGEAIAPSTAATAPMSSAWRFELELASVHTDQRLGLPDQNGYRIGVDVRYSHALNKAWRLTFSDRIDQIEPVLGGGRAARNSLREAYLGWQTSTGEDKIEFGRINVRHGQALGFNPSDFFRSGANQIVTTADPIALRANRLGTWMLRASRAWGDSSLSISWAPELTRGKSNDQPFDLDLAATNSRDRLLLALSTASSSHANFQVLGWSQAGRGTGVGGNFSWLAGDATVVYGEWAYGNAVERPDANLPRERRASARFHQAAIGSTYAVSGSLSLAFEADYNQAGLGRSDWPQLLSLGPQAAQNLVLRSLASQELIAKRALLVHAAYKGLLVKQLDFSGYARRNIDDRSTIAWLELRYHWARLDGALQLQAATGPRMSEHGSNPVLKVLQLICTAYF